MKAAYVDTSVIVALVFEERGSARLEKKLSRYDVLLSSNLLEAELRAALAREGVEDDAARLVDGIDWVLPDRPLTAELERVMDGGYLRGADAWHLACAVLVDPRLSDLHFVTLDARQREVARNIGFATPSV